MGDGPLGKGCNSRCAHLTYRLGGSGNLQAGKVIPREMMVRYENILPGISNLCCQFV